MFKLMEAALDTKRGRFGVEQVERLEALASPYRIVLLVAYERSLSTLLEL